MPHANVALANAAIPTASSTGRCGSSATGEAIPAERGRSKPLALHQRNRSRVRGSLHRTCISRRIVTGERSKISPLGFSQLVIEPGNAFAGVLAPLATRTDLKLIGHNLAFDVGMLERAGIPVRCRILDTQKLLKLVDSDRGWQDAETDIGKQRCRTWRSDGNSLNYRLKDLARHLLRVHALDFPGAMATLPMPDLVKYLKSDLMVTQALFEHIDRSLSLQDRVYADALIGPLNAMLVGMSQIGVQADAAFVAAEGQRLVDLMAAIFDEHRQAFDQRLDVGDEAIRSWVYRTGLKCRRIYSGKKRQLSVKADHLERLAAAAEHETVRRSLHLIHDYKQAQSLMVRIRSLQRHIDPRTGRIHSKFQDFQAAGRISSTNPNLQQLAAEVGPGKRKQFLGRTHAVVQIRSRNVLVATPGTGSWPSTSPRPTSGCWSAESARPTIASSRTARWSSPCRCGTSPGG